MFPLFPWAGFLFSGILAAFLYSRLRRDIFFRLLLVLGALMFPWFFFYKSQTVFKAELTLSGNLNKFGGVFLLLWFCDWLIRHCQGKLVELMKRAAKESLFVYVFHMFAIFGCIFSPGLEPFFKDTLTIIPALGLFLVLQLFVFGVSLIYEYLKDKKPKIWRWAFNLFWAGFLLVFVLRPC